MKKIRIGILETGSHHPFVYTLSRIFDMNGFEVKIYTNKFVYDLIKDRLNIKQDRLVIRKEYESRLGFLKRIEKDINENIDVLILACIQGGVIDYLSYLFFNPKPKKILTIHNANLWFNQKYSLNLKEDISLLVMRLIRNRYDALNVFLPAIKEYILPKWKKGIFMLPYRIFEKEKINGIKKIKEDKIKFVVPGAIEKNRRDYKTVLDCFENLFSKYNNISLYLLGRPIGEYGKDILNLAKKLKKRGFDICYYDKYISASEFDNVMYDCDIIIGPIRVDTYVGSQKEIYSITKDAGINPDSIAYAKPIIVPKNFRVWEANKTSSLIYEDSKDLERIIEEKIIKDEENFQFLKTKAYENSKKFTLEKTQEYARKEIFEFLN